MHRIRYLAWFIRDLAGYGRGTGRWWLLVSVAVLFVGAALAVAAQTTVPTIVYTLF